MSKSKPLELPTLLLDRNIGSKGLRRHLDSVNWLKKSQGELLFPKDAPDCDLIRAAGEANMVFVTADYAIRRRAISVQAAIDAGTQIMFVPSHQRGVDLFAALWMAREEICQLVATLKGAVFIEVVTKAKGLAFLGKQQPGQLAKAGSSPRAEIRTRPARAIKKRNTSFGPKRQMDFLDTLQLESTGSLK